MRSAGDVANASLAARIPANPDSREWTEESSLIQALGPGVKPTISHSAGRTHAAGGVAEPASKPSRVGPWRAVDGHQTAAIARAGRQHEKALAVPEAEEAEPSPPTTESGVAHPTGEFGAEGWAKTAKDLAQVHRGRGFQPAGPGSHGRRRHTIKSWDWPGRGSSVKPASSAARRDARLDFRMCA